MKNLLILLSLFVVFHTTKSQVIEKIDFTKLDDNVFVYTTYKNLNGAPYPSNSMYVVCKNEVVLIDTPWEPAVTKSLLDSINKRHGLKVTSCIVTHSHDDRTAGLEILRANGVKTYATFLTDSLCVKNGEKRAEFLFTSDTTFSISGFKFQTYYPGPGHTLDNIVVWLPEHRVLFAGCLVKSMKSKGLGNINDAYLKDWKRSLKKTATKFKNIKYLIPGHLEGFSPKALEHTINLLEAAK